MIFECENLNFRVHVNCVISLETNKRHILVKCIHGEKMAPSPARPSVNLAQRHLYVGGHESVDDDLNDTREKPSEVQLVGNQLSFSAVSSCAAAWDEQDTPCG